MRLHRITLRDVRGVTARTVHLPESGVVVVEGPNEIGKSTLLEAFDRLLDLKATSRSARAQALQPIGRDVGPFVEAEFTIGGTRVRLAKQWLRSPRTELEVLGERPEQLAGSAAQARLEQLVSHLDTTLWDALRLAQSDDGTLVPLMSSGVLQQALDSAADAHLHDGDGEQVLGLVEEEYLRYFTARTGRPTGDYRGAIEAYHAAQAEVAEAHRRLVEAEDLLDRQQRAREAVGRAVQQVGVREGDLRDARERADAVAEVVAGHERAADRFERARTAAEAARQAHAHRHERVEGVARLDEVVAALEQQLADLADRGEALRERLTTAQGDLMSAEAALEEAEDLLEQARDAREAADRRLELGRCRTELSGLEQVVATLQEQLQVVLRERAAGPGSLVTEAQRQEVDRRAQEVDVLRARHEAASAAVRVEASSSGVRVGAVDGSGVAATDLGAGQACELTATDDLEVIVPGAARVVVRSPDGDARRAELEGARTTLTRILQDLGCESVEEVRARAVAAAEAAERLRDAERDLTSMLAARGIREPDRREALASGCLPPALQDRVRACRERVALLEAGVAGPGRDPGARQPGPPTGADDAGGGDGGWEVTEEQDQRAGAAAVEAERAAGRRVRQAREARRDAAATAAAARDEAAAATAALDRLHGRLTSERPRLEQERQLLERERAERPDEVLLDLARDRTEALETARDELRRAEDAVRAADVPGLAARVQAAQVALGHARDDVEQARERLHTLTGQVELAAGEGRQELYSLAESALEDAERRLGGLDRRARAVRHLRSTLREHRESAHRAYVRPFTDALERLGRQVYGPTFAVTVDEQLSVRARTLDGLTVPFEELSGGAKEQLGILARIAVAHLVDPAQGVPVVIDDALGYSDPQRLEQMGRVFSFARGTAGEDVQVILLTCTPDRYAAIPDAHTVRLAAS
ncbi:AAA family ATPase [uncultured Serinicoccus sp.]|uniref:AAA family ATPase n=1 Tax=uncultured Serinicoccus sp. TaxID=735514 RepID=UPI002605E334|nr:AAA family ATPase [uncultured Serinicoccus sp.]